MFEKFGFGAPRAEKVVEPKLEETDGRTFELLKQKVRESASGVQVSGSPVTEADIQQAAFSAALHAEREGKALTYDEVQTFGDDMKAVLSSTLQSRIQSRPETGSMHLTDAHGVVGTAETVKGAEDLASEERAAA